MCPVTGRRRRLAAKAVRAQSHRHVAVAWFPVKNRPETGKPSGRSFPTAKGWCSRPNGRRPGRRPRGAGGEPGRWLRFGQNRSWVRLAKMRGAFSPSCRGASQRDTNADPSTAEPHCDASRSMRARAVARPHPSRRAHASSRLHNVSRVRAPQDEDEQRRGILHHVKQPNSFPRPHCCVRALPLTHPR
jgi:hypothetical protein